MILQNACKKKRRDDFLPDAKVGAQFSAGTCCLPSFLPSVVHSKWHALDWCPLAVQQFLALSLQPTLLKGLFSQSVHGHFIGLTRSYDQARPSALSPLAWQTSEAEKVVPSSFSCSLYPDCMKDWLSEHTSSARICHRRKVGKEICRARLYDESGERSFHAWNCCLGKEKVPVWKKWRQWLRAFHGRRKRPLR